MKPGFAKHGFVRHDFAGRGGARHGFGRLGFHGRRLAYRYGYGGYGAYLDDTFLGGTVAPYPVAYPVSGAPAEGEPVDVTGGIGGPLLLRHICQSEVQVVPATRGGKHEVTVTRCRLYAE